MTRGEIYRSRERVPERGYKPSFYVIVSRTFIAENKDISTVICAPVYSEVLGLGSEVILETDDGLPRTCAIRCDFLMLLFKKKLTRYVGLLSERKTRELDRALAHALSLKPIPEC